MRRYLHTYTECMCNSALMYSSPCKTPPRGCEAPRMLCTPNDVCNMCLGNTGPGATWANCLLTPHPWGSHIIT